MQGREGGRWNEKREKKDGELNYRDYDATVSTIQVLME